MAVIAERDQQHVDLRHLPAVGLFDELQVLAIDMQQGSDVRAGLRRVREKRGQPQMHGAGGEWRSQGGSQLLLPGMRRGTRFGIRNAEKSRAGSHLQTGLLQPHLNLVEVLVERRFGGRITEQVVALLVLQRLAQTAGDIVAIVEE